MGLFSKHVWHFPIDVLVKENLEISRKITSVLYKQNKLNETIQRHKSDTVVHPILKVDKFLVIPFICTV